MREVYSLKDVSFGYEKQAVLENINMTIYSGDFVGIIGENGGGKTTLLRLLTGELKPDKGDLFFLGGRDFNPEKLKKIGYVPQIDPADRMSFPVSCREMVSLGLYSDRLPAFILTKEDRNKIDHALKHVGIENLANSNYHDLSGGQKQRVLIAKALVNNPEILILDEPTVGIDQKNKIQFYRIMDHMNKVHNITIIIVTHERPEEGIHWKKIFNLKEHALEEKCLNTHL